MLGPDQTYEYDVAAHRAVDDPLWHTMASLPGTWPRAAAAAEAIARPLAELFGCDWQPAGHGSERRTGADVRTSEFHLDDGTPYELGPNVSITRTNGTPGVAGYSVIAERAADGGRRYRARLATIPDAVDGAR